MTAAPISCPGPNAPPPPLEARRLPLRQVDAGHDDGGPDQLLRPKTLAEQHYAGADAYQGDEVLVDQDPVRSHAGDARAPGGEAERAREEHRARGGGCGGGAAAAG